MQSLKQNAKQMEKKNIRIFIDDSRLSKNLAAFNVIANNIKMMYPGTNVIYGGMADIKRRADEVLNISTIINIGFSLQGGSRNYQNIILVHPYDMVRQQVKATTEGRRIVDTHLLNFNEDNLGFISTFYIQEPPELLLERVVKLSLHETGHIMGATHCSNKKCVMNVQNKSAEEIIVSLDDNTLYFLCDPCKKSIYG